MKNIILDIMSDILEMDQAALLEQFNNNEIWDSLSRVEILFAIEEEFDVQFSHEELAELITPAKLCEATIRKADI